MQILKRARNAEMDIIPATESESNVREEVNRRSFKAGYTDRDGQPRGAGKGDVPTKERQSKQLEEIIDRLQAENAKLSKENKILKMLLYSSE